MKLSLLVNQQVTPILTTSKDNPVNVSHVLKDVLHVPMLPLVPEFVKMVINQLSMLMLVLLFVLYVLVLTHKLLELSSPIVL